MSYEVAGVGAVFKAKFISRSQFKRSVLNSRPKEKDKKEKKQD